MTLSPLTTRLFRFPVPSGRWLGWVGLAWLFVGIVSGVQVFFAQPHLGLPLASVVLLQVGHALPWMPATLGIAWLARRYSLRDPERRGRHAGHHLVFGGLMVLAINLLQGLVRIALGFGTLAAFRADVVDGLLQWGHLGFVVYAVLAVAFSRAPQRPEAKPADPPGASPQKTFVETLTAQQGRRTCPVPVAEITWIEAANDYVQVHRGVTTLLASYRIGWLEQHLDPSVFARTHRSTLVNLRCVAAYEPLSHGDYELHLTDGTRLKLTRTRRTAVLQRLAHLASAP